MWRAVRLGFGLIQPETRASGGGWLLEEEEFAFAGFEGKLEDLGWGGGDGEEVAGFLGDLGGGGELGIDGQFGGHLVAGAVVGGEDIDFS